MIVKYHEEHTFEHSMTNCARKRLHAYTMPTRFVMVNRMPIFHRICNRCGYTEEGRLTEDPGCCGPSKETLKWTIDKEAIDYVLWRE